MMAGGKGITSLQASGDAHLSKVPAPPAKRLRSDKAKRAPCDCCRKIISALSMPVLTAEKKVYLGTYEEVMTRSKCRKHTSLLPSLEELRRLHLTGDSGTPFSPRRLAVAVGRQGHTQSLVFFTKLGNASYQPAGFKRLYLLAGSRAKDALGAIRLVHPSWISPSLPRRWKDRCNRLHGSRCQKFLVDYFNGVRPNWLVDVWRQCLVPGLSVPLEPYVALSYVWGRTQSLKSVRENLEQLQQPQALSQGATLVPLAPTIRDAMGVVERLGERYLWVDALCIVQNDSRTTHAELAKMAGIYANASVTIVAMQAADASEGLRGLRGISGPRDTRQYVHTLLRRTRLLEQIEPSGADVHCTWESRGWTFQEDVFSRRRLIFGRNGLEWECHRAKWLEFLEESEDKPPVMRITDVHTRWTLGLQLPDPWNYTWLVSDFTRRRYTYPQDILDAFSGIATALSFVFPGGFVSGLPAVFFDAALLWIPSLLALDAQRTMPPVSATGRRLPSWSWAGWYGYVDSGWCYYSMNARIGEESMSLKPLREWRYHESLDTEGVVIDAGGWYANKVKYCDNTLEPCPPGWRRRQVSPPDAEGSTGSHDRPTTLLSGYEHWDPTGQRPSRIRRYPIPARAPDDTRADIHAPYISCRTKRTWLYGGASLGRRVVSLADADGSWVGVLYRHQARDDQSRSEGRPETYELIELSSGTCHSKPYEPSLPRQGDTFIEWDHPERPRACPYEFYWVMWIGWEGPVACRRGLGRVWSTAWERQEREDVDVMLG